MKITITIENRRQTLTNWVEVPDGNQRFDGWELHQAGDKLLRATAGRFGDIEDRPANR